MTPESVDDLYHGITPALVPDFYGLKGDTSDNIPGVPGIGPKKASALIAQYGSLDEVIAHADEVKGKMGENLRAHIDDALLSRKVATIRTDAPVELDFEATSFPAFSADEVSAALGTLGITAMQNRFLALVGGEAGLLLPPVWLRYLLWFAQPPAMPTRLVPLRLRSPARLMPASGSPPWWTTTRKRARSLD
ncbi:MAG: 5'-3' exonuclease H3TH domain-containing protein [Collinsella sp.]